MKIAFTAKGNTWDSQVESRFGRAEYIFLYDESTEETQFIDNRDVIKIEHGAGLKTAQKLFEKSPNILITGNGPGGNALRILEKLNLKIFLIDKELTIREAYDAYKRGLLEII